MSEIGPFIDRVAKRCGFKRSFYLEKNVPTTTDNIVAIPFYGDLRTTTILSSYILPNWMKQNKDKYVILCTWPGMQSLFPYVHEIWTMSDVSSSKLLALGAGDFNNVSDLATEITTSLLEGFQIWNHRDMAKLYKDGFLKDFWSQKDPVQFWPNVPSGTKLPLNFTNALTRHASRVMIFPSTKVRTWQRGRCEYLPLNNEFWVSLAEELIENGIHPFVYQSYFSHDISKYLADKCTYLTVEDYGDVLGAMRQVGCVLDVFSGISRLALLARTPCVSVDERVRYFESRDCDLDCLSGEGIPRKQLYSYSTMLLSGGKKEWKTSIVDNIIASLNSFIPTVQDRDAWRSTSDSYTSITSNKIRERKSRTLGVRFLKALKNK